MNSSGSSDSFVASAKSTINTALPTRLSRMTRRLPTRSERRPRNGVATSCVSEKHASSTPTVLAEPPIDFT